MPLTLRLVFHGVRCAWIGVLIALLAWTSLASATFEERRALGAGLGVERPEGLVQMRIARAMVHFAPERAARMLSESSNGTISTELAGMLLRDLAKGPVAREAAFQDVVVQSPQQSRQTSGAKFVPAN